MSDVIVRRLSHPERSRLAELESLVERGLQTFVEVGKALMEIRESRLYRETHGTFETYCRERFRLGRAQAYRLIGGASVAELVSPMGDIPNERQARELVPVLRDEGEAAVLEVYRELRQKHGDDVTAERVRRVVSQRCRRIEREREAERRAAALPTPRLARDDVRIEHCDIRELDVELGSVDLIFTDPPYLAETLDTYDALAEFAARALRPGALLVAYTGNVHALECANRLARRLDFVAFAAVLLPGSMTPVFKYRMRVRLKPLLCFSRGRFEPRGWWEQAFLSPKPEKALHPWQQSEGDLGALIEALTEPGELVCDPFLGSGTTVAVAHRLGRRFVGCDIDAQAIATTAARLQEAA
ncbi:MAG: DNA methyltransferase [Thermoleophilaceae bacterium]